MNDISQEIRHALELQLPNGSGGTFEVIPIPSHGDKILRLRSLEEILDQFDQYDHVAFNSDASGTELVQYIVRVKPKVTPAPEPTRELSQLEDEDHEPSLGGDSSPRPILDGLYLPNGKLNVVFLMKNAEILFDAGDFALARNVFKTIAQSGERTGMALYGIARCYEAEKKNLEAVDFYEQAITYHPSLESYQRLASLQISLGLHSKAADAYERALHGKEMETKARFEMHLSCGNSWMIAKKPENAEPHFKRALEIEPRSAEILVNLGSIGLEKKAFLDARHFFENAIIFNPEKGTKIKALVGLGLCAMGAGDKRAAHDFLAQSLEIQINQPTAIFHLVKCAFELKSYATATRVLEEYIQIAPVNKNLLYSLAGLQFHLKRYSDSWTTCNRTLQIAPDHVGSQDLKKLLESKMNSAASSLASLEGALPKSG
jgi:tetratricopeptide (TPR) repeat protein